jgi:REP element-mobilizing transposase RayT
MVLNDAGQMVQTIWDEIPPHYPGIGIDAFIAMPNHIHGIVIVGAAPSGPSGSGNYDSVHGPTWAWATKELVMNLEKHEKTRRKKGNTEDTERKSVVIVVSIKV